MAARGARFQRQIDRTTSSGNALGGSWTPEPLAGWERNQLSIPLQSASASNCLGEQELTQPAITRSRVHAPRRAEHSRNVRGLLYSAIRSTRSRISPPPLSRLLAEKTCSTIKVFCRLGGEPVKNST